MKLTLANCGQGLNADLTPEELGLGVWSASENMRFANGYAQRFRGTAQIFATPVVTPYYITPYATTAARYWVHAGLAAVYVDDGTTRTNITGPVPTGAVADRWSGGSINGVLVMNNGVNVPTYWGGNVATPLQVLPGWDATHRCASMRPFKNYLIALDVTKGANRFPHMVKWSTTLNPGSITAAGDWAETDPAKDAGEQDLAETPDLLVDCLPLGDTNIIYKERSMYAMTYVGAPYIFRFQRLPGDSGMLARGCAVATPQGHVVLTAGDVVIHAGQGVTSICNAIVRDYIFKNIDSAYYKNAFVTSNPQRNEVWVCFPFGSSSSCNKAAVWNWIDKSWSIRSLPNVTYGASGQFNYLSSNLSWSSDSDGWDSDPTGWNENEYSPAEARLLMSHSTPRISLQDTGTTDFGALISANVERTAMHFDEPQRIKTIRSVYPRIDAAIGAKITVQVGASMVADAEPTWGTAQTFNVGVDQKIDSLVTGRYMALRLSNADYSPWRLRSLDIDFVNKGLY